MKAFRVLMTAAATLGLALTAGCSTAEDRGVGIPNKHARIFKRRFFLFGRASLRPFFKKQKQIKLNARMLERKASTYQLPAACQSDAIRQLGVHFTKLYVEVLVEGESIGVLDVVTK